MGAIVLAAGLEAIPDASGQSKQGGRTREVWMNDDWRLFDRTCKVVRKKGDVLLLRCGNELCPDRDIKLEPDAGAERGAVLRCGCTDRVFSRT
jgi:hypothetical protein